MSTEIENRYQIVFDTSPTPLLLVSAEGEILQTNDYLDRMFGYPDGELIGRRVEVLVPPDVRPHHPELLAAYMDLPSSRSMGTGRDLFGISKDGHRIPIEIGLEPINRDGENLVMVSILDITERTNSEAKIRMALDAASSAMVMIDKEGRIALTNQPTCEMFGYALAEMIGEHVELLVPESSRRRHTVYRKSYLTTRERRSMGRDRPLFGRRKDGSEFPIEIGLTPIDSHDGQFVMSTIIDITSRKYTEQIEAKNAELSRLNEDLTQLIYSASHDLKAPLTSMTGITEFIISDIEDGDTGEAAANAKNVLSLARRLSTRVESLMSLARVNQAEVALEPVDLKDLVERAWADVTVDHEEPPIFEITFEHSGDFNSSEHLISSILASLLSNACLFQDGEKSEQRVWLRTRDLGDGVELSVEDNGIGIPAESHNEVFKMFKRFSDTDAPGTGLGLAIVKKQVARLRGEIDFSSTPDGTTIRILLPKLKEAA